MKIKSLSLQRYGLVFLLSCCPALLYSQDNFEPAQVVTASGDTLSGTIDNKQWWKGPDMIRYKSTDDSPVREFTGPDLQSFAFNTGDRYVSRKVTMHSLPASLDRLDTFKDTILVKRTLFLRVLSSGHAMLYYYRDENDYDHFFIEKNGAAIDELKVLQSVTMDAQGRQHRITENRYRLSLNYYFADCPQIAPKISWVSFTVNSLQTLFEAYNQCKDPSRKPADKNESTVRVAYGPFAGFTMTSFDLGSDNHKSLNDASFSTSMDFTGGIFLDVIFNRNQQRTRWCNELSYKAYHTSATDEHYEYGGKSYYRLMTVDCSYLRFATLMNYDLANYKTARPFVKAGFSLGVAMNLDAISTLDPPYYGDSELPLLESIRTVEESLFVGLGCRAGRFQWEARYDLSTGITDIQSITNRVRTVSLLMGFSL